MLVSRHIIALGMLALLPWRSHAQEQNFGRVLFTAGTTITNASGQTWAYVFWSSPDRELIRGKSFAVFRKDGAADAATTFASAGVTRIQNNPDNIKLLINRAANLGDDPSMLSSALDEMFYGSTLDPSLPLEEKILALMLGSYSDDNAFDKLAFLARKHPALAMSMGSAMAVAVPAGVPSTFEVRLFENNTAGDILGRVTVDPLNPLLLPAPNSLAEVPDLSPRGHLNVRLRWNETDDIKRLSLLQFGYNVYRADYDFAVDKGWHTSPPATDEMSDELVAAPEQFRRVNRLPVMVNDDSTNAYFIVDDNRRNEPGGVALEDGSQYYYFVTAADLLGRDGLVSTGLLVTVCDRTPPLLPRGLTTTVIRHFSGGVATNHLRITWTQIEEIDPGSQIDYYVFRWSSISQMQTSAIGSLAGAIAGPIAHVTGTLFNSYTDTNAAGDISTVWYTVQAAEIVACGTNFSGNSAPKGGFIPDVSGPLNPFTNIVVNIRNCKPYVSTGQASYDYQSKDGTTGVVRVSRAVEHPSLAWAEVAWMPGSKTAADFPSATILGRFPFLPGEDVLVSLDGIKDPLITLFCRVGDIADKTAITTAVIEGPTRLVQQNFIADFICRDQQPGPDDREHFPRGPSGTNDIFDPVTVTIGPLTTNQTGHKFLLYQQVGTGPFTLIGQFLKSADFTNAYITLTNEMAGTLGCTEICLFSEELDKNGISAGKKPLGCYFSTVEPPARPDLLPLESAGDVTNARVSVTWFCPPPGVERFEVLLGLEEGALPASISGSLTTNLAPAMNQQLVEDKLINFGVYQTGRVGQNFGTPDSPDFSVVVPVDAGKLYYVQIISVDACGNRNASQVQTFSWYPIEAGPNVPWPARPLPPVVGNFHPRLEAVFLEGKDFVDPSIPREYPGIRIGVVTQELWRTGPCHRIPMVNNPAEYLFLAENGGEQLLPIMLYRYQVPNAKLPRVSGDVVQVSPLIEEIAYRQVSSTTIEVCDPFIEILVPTAFGNSSAAEYQIFLLDTQPVISGATYVYLVVQYDERREPKRVIPLAPLLIP